MSQSPALPLRRLASHLLTFALAVASFLIRLPSLALAYVLPGLAPLTQGMAVPLMRRLLTTWHTLSPRLRFGLHCIALRAWHPFMTGGLPS